MATTQVQTVNSGADTAKLVLAAALLVGSLVAFYLLGKQGVLLQWLVLLLGVAASLIVFFLTESGRQLIAFGKDAWREVRKVVWPARKEAMQITAYVFGFVLIMAVFLWLTDKTLEWLFYDLFLGWKK
ncbi:preprotein translocase subunit SecE [Rhodoferax aquaticus]|uniref:Protein translocase subunit SecE n=1 Tax=Rhodoferax aquaticus TaxID=2527691 RepID=A0A515EW52_9BURK|nr:preprotein translocase subunit SecE [Rhodoferax aquaticus]QDL56894.1 preprotein translocase subunit SecE [Rhodoferax aquaticus]